MYVHKEIRGVIEKDVHHGMLTSLTFSCRGDISLGTRSKKMSSIFNKTFLSKEVLITVNMSFVARSMPFHIRYYSTFFAGNLNEKIRAKEKKLCRFVIYCATISLPDISWNSMVLHCIQIIFIGRMHTYLFFLFK